MSRNDLVVGIDVGTSTAKVVIADAAGAVLVQRSMSYQYASPQPGSAEQDPEHWWNVVSELIRQLLVKNPGFETRIIAMGVSGQGASVVFLDAEGHSVRAAMLSLDRRSSAEAAAMQQECGEEVGRISGKAPASYNVEPKLRWLRANEPENWARVRMVLTPAAYITFRLSGVTVMNHSDAGILLAYDLEGRCWSRRALELMDLPLGIYPPLAECSASVGSVTAAAAAQTGLQPGVMVIAGGEDTSAAGLAVGAIGGDAALLSMGTSNTIYIPVPGTATHPRLLAFPHVVPGTTLIGGSMSSGGLATRWVSNLLANDAATPATLADLTQEADAVGAGSGGLIFLPYLAGELHPLNDGYARGVFFGLDAEMRRGHLFRAVLEANAFAIRHNLVYAREAGAHPETLLAVGGPTRNPLLCQILADVTGYTLEVIDESCGAALGSAILAAQGAGVTDLQSMQQAHTKHHATFLPQRAGDKTYERNFALYRELYPRLKDLFPVLSQG